MLWFFEEACQLCFPRARDDTAELAVESPRFPEVGASGGVGV